MVTTTIALSQYFLLGGTLEKLELRKTFTRRIGEFAFQPLINIRKEDENSYWIRFKDSPEFPFHPDEIETKVMIELNNIYKD